VILTFIIDWPILILIGLLFGYGLKGTPSRGFFLSRAFITGKVIVTLFVLIVYYSYLIAPDWMWMYYVADAEMPRWMVFYILILYYFAYAVGFALTVEGRKFHSGYPPFLMIIMIVAEVLLIMGLKARYVVVGSLAEYQAGTAIPLAESSVGQVPTYLTALLLPLGIGFLLWSRKQRFA
jgi:hypothetical protein